MIWGAAVTFLHLVPPVPLGKPMLETLNRTRGQVLVNTDVLKVNAWFPAFDWFINRSESARLLCCFWDPHSSYSRSHVDHIIVVIGGRR